MDLAKDRDYRMIGLALAVVIGGAAAVATYLIASHFAEPTHPEPVTAFAGQGGGAYKFIYYFTAFVGFGAAFITYHIAGRLADNAWWHEMKAKRSGE